MQDPKILTIHLGSQYTGLIERSCREIGVRAVVLDPAKARVWLTANTPKGIILSGGGASVTDKNAPTPPKSIFTSRAPILGICYGMQWIAKYFGGTVRPHKDAREYGPATILADRHDALFKRIGEKRQPVWTSHGDTVIKIPKGFSVSTTSVGTGGIAAMSNPKRKIWCVQFHPEVTRTKKGKTILENFLFDIFEAQKNRRPSNIIHAAQTEVLEALGDERALLGFSGGVDSTTLAAVLSPVLKKRLRAFCIDAGHLREGEREEIRAHAKAAGVKLTVASVEKRFLKALAKARDAEKKRSIFSKLYRKVMEEEAKRVGATALLQASLAPDFIESGATGGACIKSHHNIATFNIKHSLHPFRHLFKYEVRALARTLGLPKAISARQPFPGPGLFVRIIGAPATHGRLELLRNATHTTTEILERNGENKHISQLTVGLFCTPTTGVKDDARGFGHSVVVRAIQTTDFMTATDYHISPKAKDDIAKSLTRHSEIVRVLFDTTPKPPPATIEFE